MSASRKEVTVSRRRLFVLGASQVAALLPVVGVGVVGCKSRPLVCADPTASISPDEMAARNSVAYMDATPDPTKDCAKCRHFVGSPDACGTCKLLRGPIHPKGTCKVFSPT